MRSIDMKPSGIVFTLTGFLSLLMLDFGILLEKIGMAANPYQIDLIFFGNFDPNYQ